MGPDGKGPGTGGFIQAASRHNLRQLMLLRNIAIVGQTLAILLADGFLAIPLPMAALASVTGFQVLFNLATFWRLQRSWPVTDLELLTQINVDIAALTVLLYFSGGATNPFVGLFLVPVTITAATLPRVYTLPVALLTIACYALLVFFHVPLPSPGNGAPDLQLMVFGMWLNYVVSAALIAYFVVTIATLLREQNRTLAEAKQRKLDREYLVRVGALAAGAAHEIRSPLSTMAVLVKELLHQHDDRMNLTRDLRIMADQIEACQRTLSVLVTSRQDVLIDAGQSAPVDEFLDEIVEKWRMLRPGVKFACLRAGTQPPPRISTERSLSHAIVNLLNNAADASQETVEMNCRWSPGELKILIQDRGPGIPPELGDMLGEQCLTNKSGKGTGIGLLLARIAIRRVGGSLMLSNRPGGGARAKVVLPLDRASAEPNNKSSGGEDSVVLQESAIFRFRS
jgi:two-component system sensor histidine kinase RegB